MTVGGEPGKEIREGAEEEECGPTGGQAGRGWEQSVQEKRLKATRWDERSGGRVTMEQTMGFSINK